MKILCIMGGFLPGKKYGGPPVSVDNFCSLVKDEAKCFIITLDHDMGDTMPYEGIHEGWNERGDAKVLYLSDKHYNEQTFNKVIHEIEPDYIYLQGLFQKCIIPSLKLAKKYGIKVVLAPRGELCKGAFRKKYKKLPYIVVLRLFGLLKKVVFQSTSDEETEAIRKFLGASKDSIHLLSNIPSIPHELPTRAHKQSGVGKFVFISRILWKKNLLSAIRFFNGIKGDVVFDIYGPKEDLKYWEDCENAIGELDDNIKVNYRGVLDHDVIHRTFNQYDVFLFPTLSENFGHVIAEALATGCVPIISDQTPWTDINEANAGWAITLDDEKRFKKVIQEVVYMDEKELNNKRKCIEFYLEKKLKLDKLKEEYLKLFN